MNILNLIDAKHLIASPAAHLYENSPFSELRKLPPKTKGTRFEEIVCDVLDNMGYDVSPNVNKGHDLIVDGKKVEVKGSTLSSSFNNEFQFKFMQIRMNSDWDEICLLYTSPSPRDS